MRLTVNVSANSVRRRFAMGSVRAKELSEATTRAYGNRLLEEVRYRASHAPGPSVITGQYVRSIQLRFTKYRNSLTAEVYSDEPYSARLKYGFSGVDSLGRYQMSAPYPHFRPALEAIGDEYVGAMGRLRFV